MNRPGSVIISGAVEGLVDEAVFRRLVRDAGATSGQVYGKNGKPYLRQLVGGYNNAARFKPWVILVDLDQDADCAPPFRVAWLPNPAAYMCFRVTVREIESWLLSDRANLARFLSVSTSHVPRTPELLDHPKVAMVELARRSRRRNIREDMAPRPGSGRTVGPAYTSRLIEFVEVVWEPQKAERVSDSLRRCCKRLGELVKVYHRG